MKITLGAGAFGGFVVALVALIFQGCGSLILPGVATPVFSPVGGGYSASQLVSITDATPGTTIYFTTNGTTPSASSTPYTGPITVAADVTLKAIAVTSGIGKSDVATASFVISIPLAATPTISPASGTYALPQSAAIADATAGALIYYTTDGTTPTTSSTLYTGPITVSVTATLKAIAAAPGYQKSAVASSSYVIAVQPAAATPTISPGGGTYTTAQNVTISDATPGALIYYTTDGTTPTTASKTYAGPIAVSSTQTIMAIATVPGFTTSSVASAMFTIALVNPAVGTWTWIAGSDTVNAGCVYGVQGTPSPLNTPCPRSRSASWTGRDGKFWLFGGQLYDSVLGFTAGLHEYNDLWQYDPATGMWTWMGGSTTENSSGNYGTQGVPAASNVPGARAGASTWVDSQGDLWLLGGQGLDSGGNAGILDDLWMFNVQTGQWTWVGGSTGLYATGVFGTLGVASAANMPGPRAGGITWVDSQENLWLFGGQSSYFGETSDLWKFETATRQWTWVAGPQAPDAPGVYGSKGNYSATNSPGARHDGAAWTDSSGNLWLFGGQGYDRSGNSALLNDLWEFDPTATTWRWMGGSQSIGGPAAYGSIGVPSVNNIPGAREWFACWTDLKGRFWLFGGFTGSSLLNDYWMFDPASQQWTWVAGSNTAGASGVYGTPGTSGSVPGARLAPATWVDTNSQLWLFGGYGFEGSGKAGNLNDLWTYKP